MIRVERESPFVLQPAMLPQCCLTGGTTHHKWCAGKITYSTGTVSTTSSMYTTPGLNSSLLNEKHVPSSSSVTYRNFFLNNQPDALIIPMLFCYKSLHVSGIFSAHHQEFFYCTFGTGKFHAGFWWPLPSRVRMEQQFHPDSACMKLTSAECTVESPWWWAEKMPETCRVL